MAEKLNDAERETLLQPLLGTGWVHEPRRDALLKTFTFANFVEAFGWMTQIAIRAEKLNHHPEWSNVYKTVDVTLTTHDAGGLTELDIQLASLMDKTWK
ncbi:MAG: 4a-hydroxytetrahydrobiopterin dehydratase [Rhodobacteraceae bacterium]|nr:4a-hydroxytetrahydrobiopterin dehydratase [Paracoccaceae bacterium]